MADLRLNQLIPLVKGAKGTGEGALTSAYHALQKAPLLAGIARTYQPKDDEGEQLPPESTRVQVRTEEVLDTVAQALTRLLDLTTTLDTGNQAAKANIEIDGEILIPNVPVTTLLMLEKKLVDLRTFVSKLPVLDAAESWDFDEAADCWATEPVQTVKTKKIPRNHVLSAATDKHPAQVQMYYEDVVVGHWSTVKFSGALPATRVKALLERVDKLQAAVKTAREQANMTQVEDQRIGDKIFQYLAW